jgi:hypothetical protein
MPKSFIEITLQDKRRVNNRRDCFISIEVTKSRSETGYLPEGFVDHCPPNSPASEPSEAAVLSVEGLQLRHEACIIFGTPREGYG